MYYRLNRQIIHKIIVVTAFFMSIFLHNCVIVGWLVQHTFRLEVFIQIAQLFIKSHLHKNRFSWRARNQVLLKLMLKKGFWILNQLIWLLRRVLSIVVRWCPIRRLRRTRKLTRYNLDNAHRWFYLARFAKGKITKFFKAWITLYRSQWIVHIDTLDICSNLIKFRV